jgi:ribosomal protein S18 acetylase RimI-like enzyme
MPIAFATTEDIPQLVILLNRSYRGDESRKGWTTEADLISGNLRIDADNMKQLMQLPSAVFLKYTENNNNIAGCVFLDKREKKLYLGMLCVAPDKQDKGIGNELLTAAEKYAITNQCRMIFMNVISERTELINWYIRKGYYQTNERKPFPADNRFGTPNKPIEFIILEKKLEANPELQ